MTDWFDRNPDDLAERSEPADALAAVQAQDHLTAPQLAVLDVFLNHWVLAALQRPNDREGVLELQQLCELAHDLAEPSPEAQAFCPRLEAFGDLLEGKRRTLQAIATGVPFKLYHEDDILQTLAQRETKQADLVAQLKLSAGRVSQILGVMESKGQIVRARRGKESWVALPSSLDLAQQHLAPYRTGKIVSDMFSTSAQPTPAQPISA